jgi:hypothetical protein
MKAEYNFPKGERGKFYNADAVFSLPVYLDPDVDEFMSKLAAEKGLDIQELVNNWLRANIRLVQSLREQKAQDTRPRIAE